MTKMNEIRKLKAVYDLLQVGRFLEEHNAPDSVSASFYNLTEEIIGIPVDELIAYHESGNMDEAVKRSLKLDTDS